MKRANNEANPMKTPGGEVVFYKTPDGHVSLDVHLVGESVWLSLNQMVELFGRDKSVISRHLRNIFDSGELKRKATVAKNAPVHQEGGQRTTDRLPPCGSSRRQ